MRTFLMLPMLATIAAMAQAAPAPMPSVLRVGYKATATAACAAPNAKTPAAVSALAKHLANRLQLAVQLCPFADPNVAAAALAKGAVDFANLSPAAWPVAKGKGRPILTVRPDGKLPRTPILAVAKKSAGMLNAAAIAKRHVVVIKQEPLAYDAARAAILTRGGAALGGTPVTGSFAAAIAALASGKADVALMSGDEWKAGCAADKTVCPPYQVAWHDRPVADSAWVLRAGLPDELRYRLIGIFMAMSLENTQAYAGAAGGVKGVFEPTEATALDGSAGR
jgi:ABC-type phosphate/phosphonate transport system substrate-binding protein